MSLASRLLALMTLACVASRWPCRALVACLRRPQQSALSNEQQQGFENHVASLIANDMGMQV